MSEMVETILHGEHRIGTPSLRSHDCWVMYYHCTAYAYIYHLVLCSTDCITYYYINMTYYILHT